MAKRKLKVAVIREELVELTGDAISALVLNQAIYHHHAIEDMDNSTMEFIEKLEKQGAHDLAEQARKNLRNGWFYKSPNSFFKEIMISSRSTVKRRLENLVEMGYMIKGGQNLGFADVDDTWWKVDIQKIRKDLAKLGYTLNGYPMWEDEEENEGVHSEQGTDVPGVHGEQGGVHGEQGGVHGEHHLKNTTKDNYKEISSSSRKLTQESIDEELKAKYPNVPFENIKQDLLDDSTAVINTLKQYKSLLEYRLKNWKSKPNKQIKRTKGNRKPIRKEPIPEWQENPEQIYLAQEMDQQDFEKQKKELEERLKKYKKNSVTVV